MLMEFSRKRTFDNTHEIEVKRILVEISVTLQLAFVQFVLFNYFLFCILSVLRRKQDCTRMLFLSLLTLLNHRDTEIR